MREAKPGAYSIVLESTSPVTTRLPGPRPRPRACTAQTPGPTFLLQQEREAAALRKRGDAGCRDMAPSGDDDAVDFSRIAKAAEA